MQRCRHPDGHPGSGPGVRRLSASAETTLLSPEQRAGMAFRLAARPPGPAQRHEQCLARVHKCRAMRHFHGVGRIRARPQEERPLPAYAYSSLPLARYRRCPQGRRGAGVRPHVHAPARLPAPRATIRIPGDLGPPSRSSTHLHPCLAQLSATPAGQPRAAVSPCRRDNVHADQYTNKNEFASWLCRHGNSSGGQRSFIRHSALNSRIEPPCASSSQVLILTP